MLLYILHQLDRLRTKLMIVRSLSFELWYASQLYALATQTSPNLGAPSAFSSLIEL